MISSERGANRAEALFIRDAFYRFRPVILTHRFRSRRTVAADKITFLLLHFQGRSHDLPPTPECKHVCSYRREQSCERVGRAGQNLTVTRDKAIELHRSARCAGPCSRGLCS